MVYPVVYPAVHPVDGPVAARDGGSFSKCWHVRPFRI